jgi:hypothetical protein
LLAFSPDAHYTAIAKKMLRKAYTIKGIAEGTLMHVCSQTELAVEEL